jgi:beta-lactamase superfamily II metal-dependent hydrolase
MAGNSMTDNPMADKLRIRVYNVRFGDAILIWVPARVAGGRTETRHILVDVGNVLGGKGGEDSVFKPVVEDVLKVLDGEPLDLYVMTHEHLDHIQGLYYVSTKLGLDLKVKRAWLTASAAEDYYERNPEARKKRSLALAAFDAVQSYFSAAGEKPSPFVQAMLLNNNPRSSSQCVDYLRKLAAETVYVHREADPGPLPFQEPGTKIDIWGPEEDTSIYYGAFRPAALGVTAGAAGERAAATTPNPPAGVDAGAFYDLVEFRRRGYGDNLLALDAAANNSSVVFCLEWRGWRLLFPGDAEQRAWKEMDRRGKLGPVHFLKVGHHGSANGTPLPELLAKILPETPPDGRPRSAAVSTCAGSYSGVPHPETMKLLHGRCDLRSVEDLPDNEFFMDFEFPG